jgi:hypothetical protein
MRLPEELGDKVVLFDADSRVPPTRPQPLEGDDVARTVDNLVSSSPASTPPPGDRAPTTSCAPACSPCAHARHPVLTDLPKLLTVPAFRHRAVDQINDDILRGFWSWYDDLSDPARAQVTAP